MKYCLPAIILTLGLGSPVWSQDAPATDKKVDKQADDNSSAVNMWRAFTNLPKEKRQEYFQILLKVQNLFNQKRIFDTLEKLDELDKIFPDHPASLNIRGACYVELRAFSKADKIFTKVLKIAPDNTNVHFNLAEVDFVSKKWDSAHKRFEKIITMLPESQKSMIRLCEFKLLLCNLKLGRFDEAKALKDKYDIWDDSPFYYYSRAAIAYHADKKREAERLLRSVRYVWRSDATLAPWQDTLIEFGYIRSFYGGDTEEE